MNTKITQAKNNFEPKNKCNRKGQKLNHQYLLFDMDGTLLDSMNEWSGLIESFLDLHSYSIPKHIHQGMMHMRVSEVAQYMHENIMPDQTPADITRSIYDLMARHYREDVTIKPGVVEYLTRCRQEGKRMAVVTATARELALPVLERLQLDSYFDLFLSTRDIGISKTEPDIYVQASRELGAQTNSQAAVFEDAPYALETAAKAGFYTILLDDPVYREEQVDYIHLADEYYLTMEELL
ncbi:MAG: HAD family phosphatase [Clostridiaceae bacterium]|nr:HAD family phosphatase [Clostridiaceae bacterium]